MKFIKTNRQNMIRFCIALSIFVVVFCGLLTVFGAYFVREVFGGVGFEQILFHLRFPLLGEGTPFVGKFINKVLLPAFVCAFVITFPQFSLKILAKIATILVSAFFKKATLGKLSFAVVLFGLCLNISNNKLKITHFLKTQSKFSNLYETHYKPFDSANLAGFSPKQNLILILAESLESTFSAKNIPQDLLQIAQNGGGGARTLALASTYSPFGELIPNLSTIALQNTNFSSTDTLGGITQTSGSSWTIAGTISYLCGIPLNMPIGGNSFANKHFLDSAVCVSDILARIGYKQAYFSNFDSSFAGNKFFFEAHSVEVLDLPYFQARNLVPNPLPQNLQGVWGLKDAELFRLAKNHIESLQDSEPFALYISTIDTHSTDNEWVDKTYCAGNDISYSGAIYCTDKIISDFVKWVQNSRFGENTTIVILGDHLSAQQGFFPFNAKRFVYNAFINPRFSQNPRANLTKNRVLSHFDITPLLLDSIGLHTQSFGLGRNPLVSKTLLESEFSLDNFNALLTQRNKIYDSFWEVKKK